MPKLTHRAHILLDDEQHQRLRKLAMDRGISVAVLICEAIDEKLSRVQETPAAAFAKLLEAEPMPIEDWPTMKKQMCEDRYAKVMKLYDERS